MSKSYKKTPWSGDKKGKWKSAELQRLCVDISGIISKIRAKVLNTRESTVPGTYATMGSCIHGKSIGRMCRKRIHMRMRMSQNVRKKTSTVSGIKSTEQNNNRLCALR